tara:strand:+ start:1623 stop:1880 length:258 start_codon:yes stop_codon:yes gene_type:complete
MAKDKLDIAGEKVMKKVDVGKGSKLPIRKDKPRGHDWGSRTHGTQTTLAIKKTEKLPDLEVKGKASKDDPGKYSRLFKKRLGMKK